MGSLLLYRTEPPAPPGRRLRGPTPAARRENSGHVAGGVRGLHCAKRKNVFANLTRKGCRCRCRGETFVQPDGEESTYIYSLRDSPINLGANPRVLASSAGKKNVHDRAHPRRRILLWLELLFHSPLWLVRWLPDFCNRAGADRDPGASIGKSYTMPRARCTFIFPRSLSILRGRWRSSGLRAKCAVRGTPPRVARAGDVRIIIPARAGGREKNTLVVFCYGFYGAAAILGGASLRVQRPRASWVRERFITVMRCCGGCEAQC